PEHRGVDPLPQRVLAGAGGLGCGPEETEAFESLRAEPSRAQRPGNRRSEQKLAEVPLGETHRTDLPELPRGRSFSPQRGMQRGHRGAESRVQPGRRRRKNKKTLTSPSRKAARVKILVPRGAN